MTKLFELIRDRLVTSRDIHVRWRDWLKKHPEREEEYRTSAGDIKHQKQCVSSYNKAIEALNKIETKIKLSQ